MGLSEQSQKDLEHASKDSVSEYTYSAFISYNHKDRRWASWLHRKLEGYRIPKALHGRRSSVGFLQDRLPPVFQDREELAASSDLAESVKLALSRAANLIVICSPNSAKSRWVNEEIREFTRLGRRDRIHLLVIDGVPGSQGGEESSFPPALFEHNEAEPLAADLRDEADGKQLAFLKITAGLLDVGLDELRQRELVRRNRRLAIIASASLAGVIATSALAIVAMVARTEAVEQRDLARRQTMTAQRTSEFVQSLFEVSNPSEAKGNELTARQMLDAGARRITGGLNREPDVKAQLMATLSRVYLGLGSFKQADAIIGQSMALPVQNLATAARRRITLAESRARQGDFDGALRQFDAAIKQARLLVDEDPHLLSDSLAGRADAESALGNYQQADSFARAALAIDTKSFGANDPTVARDLEVQGFNLIAWDKLEEAKPLFDRALAIRIPQQGIGHPKVAEDYNELGAIAYLQGKASMAEALWLKTLKSDELVLGPNHPDVAATLNNVARVQIEQRKFGAARGMLQRSIAIVRKEQNAEFEDLAFTYANMGLAERGLGNYKAAERWLGEALKVAERHKNRNLAPIMVDLAEARCLQSDAPDGIRLLYRAGPIMKRDYPNDRWRQAWLVNTQGFCRVVGGDIRAARIDILASSAAIRERWGKDTYYGKLVSDRSALVSR